MVNQQDVPTGYIASGDRLRAMSWVGMYNRTAGRKVVVLPSEEPPSGKRNRTAVIEQLLGMGDKDSTPRREEMKK